MAGEWGKVRKMHMLNTFPYGLTYRGNGCRNGWGTGGGYDAFIAYLIVYGGV